MEQRILFLVQVRSITMEWDMRIVCFLSAFVSIFVLNLSQWTNGFTMGSEERVPARNPLPLGHIYLPIWGLSHPQRLHKCLDVISSFTKQRNKRQQVLKLCGAFILLPAFVSGGYLNQTEPE